MITRGRDLTGEPLECDVVVVGTGAGGGMLLRDAALAGLRVIAVEEGAYRTSKDFDGTERHMLPLLFQESGARATSDGAIQILQGRGVGGSTVHNTNLCRRTPDPILSHWAEAFGLASWRPDGMAADFAAVEALLHVSPIDAARVNRNNDVLLRGMAALGWRGGLLAHNRRGCMGSGQCELGCPFNAKENVQKALLPDALDHGATVLCETRVERVLVDDRRAVGVIARGLLEVDGERREGAEVRIRARAVVLAGSAIGSAHLALESAIPSQSRLVGRNLHLHPGVAIAGLFDERIEGWSGIPQSVECTEHIDWLPGSERRIWIVPAFVHPVGFAASLPGFGAAHMRLVRRYPHVAILVAMLHDESAGRVEASGGRPRIRYSLEPGDVRAFRRGIAACARLLQAAGAREIVVPARRPIALGVDGDAGAAAGRLSFAPFDPPLVAVHPMGTLPMARDPSRGVTDEDGRWHGVAGLYVADGSLFPTSIGGPPQITIYTAGRRVARTVASDLAAAPR